MIQSSCPTWLEINTSALEHNARTIAEYTGVSVLAVVKDNGYGHGAIEVAKAVLRGGAAWLAVVRTPEAHELRDAGITSPMIIFGGALPAEMDKVIARDISLPLISYEQAEMLSRRSKELGKPARVHLKVDTGMGRFGVFAHEALGLSQHALELGGIEIEGIFSHLACAGDEGDTLTPIQIKRFKEAIQSLHSAGIHPRWEHLASSGAIQEVPESYFNMVRAGGAVYGLGGRKPERPLSMLLKSAFVWKAQLVSCKAMPEGWTIGYGSNYLTRKDEVIGVVPVGHGDGYRRLPGNEVLIGGQRVPVVGNICMDQFMISLPHPYPLGEEVVLIGKQGNEEITTFEVRNRWKSTNSGVCLVHPRVPRFYVSD
jgi:alanine racemase